MFRILLSFFYFRCVNFTLHWDRGDLENYFSNKLNPFCTSLAIITQAKTLDHNSTQDHTFSVLVSRCCCITVIFAFIFFFTDSDTILLLEALRHWEGHVRISNTFQISAWFWDKWENETNSKHYSKHTGVIKLKILVNIAKWSISLVRVVMVRNWKMG